MTAWRKWAAAAAMALLADAAPAQEATPPPADAPAAEATPPAAEAPAARAPRRERARAAPAPRASAAGSIGIDVEGFRLNLVCPDGEPFQTCLAAANALIDRLGPPPRPR